MPRLRRYSAVSESARQALQDQRVIFPNGLHGPQQADENPKSAAHPDTGITKNDWEQRSTFALAALGPLSGADSREELEGPVDEGN